MSAASKLETKTDKPAFSNLFSGFGQSTVSPKTVQTPPENKAEIPSASNQSGAKNEDGSEDYVPTAHFEPVISLPDLVEVKTGEENEEILFEHRAKLLRFVKEIKEWKERGIGNMKVLVNKDDPNKVRLLMRREQVLKLCCNQMLAKDTKFNKLPKSEVAMSWFGQDYSENELQIELLAIRFKTADVCKQFHDAILGAQSKMTLQGKAGPAEAQPTSTLTKSKTDAKPMDMEKKGFGEQFKPKAGSWSCEGCYLTNKESEKICAACNAPRDKDATDTASGTGGNTNAINLSITSKFNFGSQPATSKPVASKPTTQPAAIGFGDKFKPKLGSWECKACYTSNTADKLYCLACEGPKDDTVPKKESTSVLGAAGKIFS